MTATNNNDVRKPFVGLDHKPLFDKKTAWAIQGILEAYFPWLGTDDGANGSDTVDAVLELWERIEKTADIQK